MRRKWITASTSNPPRNYLLRIRIDLSIIIIGMPNSLSIHLLDLFLEQWAPYLPCGTDHVITEFVDTCAENPKLHGCFLYTHFFIIRLSFCAKVFGTEIEEYCAHLHACKHSESSSLSFKTLVKDILPPEQE